MPFNHRLCSFPDFEQQRELWGCDKPHAQKYWSIPCWICEGQSRQCPNCEGGTVSFDQCPWAMAPTWAFNVCSLTDLASAQVLPVQGGIMEQSSWFVKALGFCLKMKGLVEPND